MSLESLLPSLEPEDRRILLNVLLALKVDASPEGRERIFGTVLAFRHVDTETVQAIVREAEQTYCLVCGKLVGTCEAAECDDDPGEEDEEDDREPQPLDAELEARTLDDLAGFAPYERIFVFDNLLPLSFTDAGEDRWKPPQQGAFDLANLLETMTDEDRVAFHARLLAIYCDECGVETSACTCEARLEVCPHCDTRGCMGDCG